MKSKNSIAIVVFSKCICLLAFADTITLKNGEKIEGSILRETEKEYVVEIPITSSFKQEKVIAKNEIRSIEKERPDLVLYEKISKWIPTPELVKEEQYDEWIEQVESYLKEYPQSPMVKKVAEIHDVLLSERNVIREGGVKLGETLVSGDDYAANAYHYDALISEKEIRKAIERRELLLSLKLFTAHDAKFADSEGRQALVASIRKVLAVLQGAVVNGIATFDVRVAQQKAGLPRMSPQDRAQTERALEEQAALLKERLEAEKAAKSPWVTPDENLKESLEESLRQIEAEIKRLETNHQAAKEGFTPLDGVYRDAWQKISVVTAEEQKAVLDELRRLRLPEVYLEKIAKRGELALANFKENNEQQDITQEQENSGDGD